MTYTQDQYNVPTFIYRFRDITFPSGWTSFIKTGDLHIDEAHEELQRLFPRQDHIYYESALAAPVPTWKSYLYSAKYGRRVPHSLQPQREVPAPRDLTDARGSILGSAGNSVQEGPYFQMRIPRNVGVSRTELESWITAALDYVYDTRGGR